jgi:hypothetical protein
MKHWCAIDYSLDYPTPFAFYECDLKCRVNFGFVMKRALFCFFTDSEKVSSGSEVNPNLLTGFIGS